MKFKAIKEEQENYGYYHGDSGFKYSDEENVTASFLNFND